MLNSQVSIVIPTLNEENNIRICLDLIYDLGFCPKIPLDDFEVIVIDNGSSDKTVEIVNNYKTKRENLKLYHCSRQGIASARNLGIEKSNFKLIALVDADTFVTRGAISKLICSYSKLSHKNNVIAVSGISIAPKNASFFRKTLFYMTKSFLGNIGSVQSKHDFVGKETNHLSSFFCLFNKSTIGAVKFDDSFDNILNITGGEDLDFFYRLKKIQSAKYYVICDSLVVHLWSDSILSWLRKVFNYAFVRMYFAKKNLIMGDFNLSNVFSSVKFIFPILLVLGLLFIPLNLKYLFIYLFYFSTILFSYFFKLGFKKIGFVFSSSILLFLTHMAYGLGQVFFVLNIFRLNNKLKP